MLDLLNIFKDCIGPKHKITVVLCVQMILKLKEFWYSLSVGGLLKICFKK